MAIFLSNVTKVAPVTRHEENDYLFKNSCTEKEGEVDEIRMGIRYDRKDDERKT